MKMTLLPKSKVCNVLWLCIVLLISGCEGWSRREKTTEAPSAPSSEYRQSLDRLANSAATRGTIGEQIQIQGLQAMRVRGYGLVVGLDGRGSRTCPDAVRSRLLKDIRKYGFGDSRLGLEDLSPEKMVGSPDTAVVLVQGSIPSAALRGTRFDLTVQALPGTETSSIEGGFLYTCELRLFRMVGEELVQEGKILARGSGPVFINPFNANPEKPVDDRNLRLGKVIGGGLNLEDRRVGLVLNSPSYALAIRIQNRINNRFGGTDKIATAESPAFVKLHIPDSYLGMEAEFLALVRHLYLSDDPAFSEQQARRLADELTDLDAPHDNISLALEGLGKSIKPILRNLYTHPRPHVHFYASRAGLRLEDRLAVNVLREHAKNPDSNFQLEAIQELGRAVSAPQAAETLYELAASDLDPRVRVQALKGLVEHQDLDVMNEELGQQFTLEYLPISTQQPIISAQVEGQARLYVIGQVPIRTPVFYIHPHNVVTINAEAGSDQIALLRTTPGGRTSPTVEVPLDTYALIKLLGQKADEDKFGQVSGLGLTYNQLLEVLASLCENSTLAAAFRLERVSALEMIGTSQRRLGRPESEL